MAPCARSVLALLAVALLLAACGDDSSPELEQAATGIRVASFDFDESMLLAELYAQVLEAEGVPVVRLGAVGPREIVAPAMELDHVDLVPEYLGTALQYAGSTEPSPDAEAAVAELNEELAPKGLLALAPSQAEDKNAIVVTAATAEAEGLETISDLLPIVATQRFGGPAECPDRPLCLVGLAEVYGLHFAEFVPQRSLEFTAEALRRGEIDVGLMFSTAAELDASDLVELSDDRRLQPPENIVPVVRADVVERWGSAVIDSLAVMSAALTTSELRAMNGRVAAGEPMTEIAGDWLADHGLLGG